MRSGTVLSTLLFLRLCNAVSGPRYILRTSADVRDVGAIERSLQERISQRLLRTAPGTESISISLRPLQLPRSTTFPGAHYLILSSTHALSEEIRADVRTAALVDDLIPERFLSVDGVPNDSAYASQWNLQRIGISGLFEQGAITSDLPVSVIGVIDTGIDPDHPDLVNRLAYNTLETGLDALNRDKRTNGIDDDLNGFIDDWKGYDFVDGAAPDAGDWTQPDNEPEDEHGHGTAVSGIIGAETGNGIGTAGVSPCRILPVRAFGKNGRGSDIDIALAIIYAADNGASVINMSFGDVISSPFLHEAIRYAASKNIILVASSGNDGSPYPHYPSDFTEVISTGSVGTFDVRSIFSGYSPSLDLTAPGESIPTTSIGGGYTDNFSGTSAAAPHVAAVAGLMKSFEKARRSTDPTLPPMSGAEIRDILVNTATDIGASGWDAQTGAGVVNAQRAVSAVRGGDVQVHYPRVDDIVSPADSVLIISAVTPYLSSVRLEAGQGERPETWKTLWEKQGAMFLHDTVRIPALAALSDGYHILRLIVRNSKGNDVEVRQRIEFRATAPALVSLQFSDSVITDGTYCSMVTARTDRNTAASLEYRGQGSGEWKAIRSAGTQRNHAFLITSGEFRPGSPYDIRLRFTETGRQARETLFGLTDSMGRSVQLSGASISTTGLTQRTFTLPAGYLLNSVVDPSSPKLAMNEYSAGGDFGQLSVFQYHNGTFLKRDSTRRVWIPKSFGTDPVWGKTGAFVHDRGISALFTVDPSSGTIDKKMVWGDSSDVWGSEWTDIDGDGLRDIVARTSTDYRLYRGHLSNGILSFAPATVLPNPSAPLPGEAVNQFGPPRSVTGRFTDSGRREIVFADYDGDMMLYRQTGSDAFNFSLAGLDTTDLFETGEFLAKGDFDGDGLEDIVVAGHSRADLNDDREYDAPVWVARVFSHRPADTPGSLSLIWEQKFAGVRSGSGYDNGVQFSKLRSGDIRDALLLSLNPYLYIFEWDTARSTFAARWMHRSESNGIIVHDFDGDGDNELGFHSDGKVRFWSRSASTGTMSAPWGLTATVTGPSSVALRWNSFALTHRLYRGTTPDSLSLFGVVNGTSWTDSSLAAEVRYHYAVAPFDGPEGERSAMVSAVPHAPAVITAVTQGSARQLVLRLSQTVRPQDAALFLFTVSGRPSHIVVWKDARTVVASYADDILAGSHTVRIRALTDDGGLPGDTAAAFLFTSVWEREERFFVRSVALEGKDRIVLDFSNPPAQPASVQPVNYRVRSSVRTYSVTSVETDVQDDARIILRFAPGTDLTALALRLEVTLTPNLLSLAGVPLMGGKGQTVSIEQTSLSLDKVVVFPNPVRGNGSLSFANLPPDSRVTIFSLGGERVAEFGVDDGSGLAVWDLRTNGADAGSGIYIYRIVRTGPTGEENSAMLGKVAVIR